MASLGNNELNRHLSTYFRRRLLAVSNHVTLVCIRVYHLGLPFTTKLKKLEIWNFLETSLYWTKLGNCHSTLGSGYVSWLIGPGDIIFMMTSSNGNIFRVTDPFWGESTGHRWIPLKRVSNTGFYVFFDVSLNKRLNKQPSAGDWRRYGGHCDVIVMFAI